MSSSSALPPPGNLPSWSRVSTLDRSRYPKPFLRDRIPLPPAGGNSIQTEAVVDFNSNLSSMDVKILEGISASDQQRLICYNKSIKFLQQQHSETLSKLHEELEKLKKENKDLQFKIIMSQGKVLSPDPPSDNIKTASLSHTDDIQSLVLREEIKDLRKALKDSQQKNSSLQKSVLCLQKQRLHYILKSGVQKDGSLSTKSSSEISAPNNEQIAGDNERVSRHRRTFSISSLSNPLPLNATLNPLKVKDDGDQLPRVPTVPECELIIKQLHELNCQQLSELSKLRMDAREVATRKLTPEPYILTTYGPSENESFSDTRLPRIPMKPLGKKHIASASSADRIVTLPALKNSMASNIADRHKRLQAVQKARSKKEF